MNNARLNIEQTTKPIHNFPGLPGKRVKPSNPGNTALGIIELKVDTDVTTKIAPAPKQLYPTSKPIINAFRLQKSVKKPLHTRKSSVPAPLQLENGLSPFDRYVPLVLSVPGTARSTKNVDLSKKQSNDNKREKTPPPIPLIITPEQREERLESLRSQLRASSVYSRGISIGRSPRNYDQRLAYLSPAQQSAISTPPMPHLALERRPSSALSSVDHTLSPSPNTAATTSTEGVLPTPCRSGGWWNVLLSPFMYRSSSRATTATIMEEDDYVASRNLVDSSADAYRPHTHIPETPHMMYSTPNTGEAAKYYDPMLEFPSPLNFCCTAGLDRGMDTDKVESGGNVVIQTDGVPETVQSHSMTAQTRQLEDVLEESSDDSHQKMKNDQISPLDEVNTPEDISRVPDESAENTSPPLIASPEPRRKVAAAWPLPAPLSTPYLLPTAKKSSAPRQIENHLKVPDGNNHQPFRGEETEPEEDSKSPAEPFSPELGIASVQHFQPARSVAHMTRTGGSQRSSEARISRGEQDLAKLQETFIRIENPVIVHYDFPRKPEPALREEVEPHWNIQPDHFYARERADYEKEWKIVPYPQDVNKKPRPWGRWLLIMVTILFFIMIVVVVTLCMTLTRTQKDMPVQAAWLNLTGFPPIETGISTIVQPSVTAKQAGCVSQPDVWSCSTSIEERQTSHGSDVTLPTFRIEIRYDDQSIKNKSLTQIVDSQSPTLNIVSNAAAASRIVQDAILAKRDAFTNSFFTSSPSPPDIADQIFLGNYTDHNAVAYEGESTPFFISFLPLTNQNGTYLRKRDISNSSTTSTNDTSNVPAPNINPNGTAAAAVLTPSPISQPLRLFNRSLPTEHYGFYTYFDRSLFLQLSSAGNSSTSNSSAAIAEATSNAICTWSQTRFLVQIWTQSANIIAPSPSSNSSAFDFASPGSFSLPVTVNIDRHGGDPAKKGVYCYGLDDQQRPVSNAKIVVPEDRSFGGFVINGATGSFVQMDLQQVELQQKDNGTTKYGGIDGGNGGCSCRWDNR